MTTAASAVVDRAVMRERERRKRQRRQARLHEMRETVAALETALPVMLTLDETSNDVHGVQWEGFLDETALSVRRRMLQTLALVREAEALRASRNQLQALLHEHQVASLVIAGLLRREQRDEWDDAVVQWRKLARDHFVPWTEESCLEVVRAAQKAIDVFNWSTNKQTSGLSFLGWREFRRVDVVRGMFQFEFYKTYRGFDMMDSVRVAFDTYTDAHVYDEVIIGPHARGSHEVLQRLGPDLMTVRCAERYPALDLDVHVVYIVSRAPTKRGFTLYVQSICCSELMKHITGPRAVWPSNFMWFKWKRLKDDPHAYKLRTGGSIGGTTIEYAQQWMLEVFGCVLRGERLYTKRNQIWTE